MDARIAKEAEPPISTKWLFFIGLCINALVLFMFPPMTDEQRDKLIRFPKSGDDLRSMNEVIQFYMEDHFILVLVAYCSIFVK